jgi:broad-specificity NMP kinase
MLLLVTGASGVGKTTVRRMLEVQVAPEVECVELADVAPLPERLNLPWRQQATEMAVQHAVQLEADGRHLLLCGDPIAAVEVVAAPSSAELNGMAFCLLHAAPQAQESRLAARGDDLSVLVHHQNFAEWMRRQATDPMHMLNVVTTDGWDQMHWDRIPRVTPRWHVHCVDTTDLNPADTADAVLAWLRAALAGVEPILRGSDLS